MKLIPLTKGYTAVIDSEDYMRVSQFKWHAAVSRHTVYAVCHMRTHDGHKVLQRLHRFILGLPAGRTPQVDHEDGNGLNNRRGNLRPATVIQNSGNQRKKSGASSKYKGVAWHKRAGKWVAYICIKGKLKHLGYFESERAASKTYNAAAVQYFGPFALLNA